MLKAVHDARRVLAGIANRTPLVGLNLPDAPAPTYLKLENLQPTGAFKIRGAAYAMACLAPDQLARGVLTASAGNMAQALAWNARGYAYLLLRDHASAIQNFDRAIELNPKYGNAYRNRAAARRVAGDLQGAAADLERAKQLEK